MPVVTNKQNSLACYSACINRTMKTPWLTVQKRKAHEALLENSGVECVSILLHLSKKCPQKTERERKRKVSGLSKCFNSFYVLTAVFISFLGFFFFSQSSTLPETRGPGSMSPPCGGECPWAAPTRKPSDSCLQILIFLLHADPSL